MYVLLELLLRVASYVPFLNTLFSCKPHHIERNHRIKRIRNIPNKRLKIRIQNYIYGWIYELAKCFFDFGR